MLLESTVELTIIYLEKVIHLTSISPSLCCLHEYFVPLCNIQIFNCPFNKMTSVVFETSLSFHPFIQPRFFSLLLSFVSFFFLSTLFLHYICSSSVSNASLCLTGCTASVFPFISERNESPVGWGRGWLEGAAWRATPGCSYFRKEPVWQ